MKTIYCAAAVVLSVPLLATAPAFAAEPLSTEQFVEKAAMSDMFEIETGRLAAKQAEHEDVKEYGDQMVDDHSETSEELKELVKDEELNVKLPTALDQTHQAKLDKLKDVSGRQFDKAYVPGQVMAHEEAVNMFQTYAKSGENEEVREWAEDTLPALKEHLKEARTLNEELSKVPSQTAQDEHKKDKGTVAYDDSKRQADAMEKKDHDAKAKKAMPPSKINYVTRQSPTDWTAQALIGRTVENIDGENLGEINNVILNEKGDVVAVTIGVGGFLGIGEKDVGVPFDTLQFRTQESMADARNEKSKEERTAESREARHDAEHSDMQIVLNATREQLENAPRFVWLDEQDDNQAAKNRERAVQ